MDRQSRTLQRQAFRSAVKRLGGRADMGAPVRDAFFLTQDRESGAVRHPMAQLMSSRSGPGGGRGGQTRVALYLSSLWLGVAGDYSTQRPASFWAALLGLDDPGGLGSRVIRSTWAELEQRRFVALKRGERFGDVPVVRPLREDGSGEPYTRPTGTGDDTYRRVPEKFFELLLPDPELTGPGLVMYLAAVRTSLVGGRTDALTFPRAYVTRTFGIGESTRKAGLRNLVSMLVLDPERRTSDETGEFLSRRRLRTVYTLMPPFTPPEPNEAPQAAALPGTGASAGRSWREPSGGGWIEREEDDFPF